MTVRAHPTGLLVIVLALSGCESPKHPPLRLAEGRSGLTVAERRQILSWLQCEECVDGELERVPLLAGKEATTVDSLRQDLLGGPSATRRSNVRAQFESSYQEDSLYSVSEDSRPPLTRTEYADHYLDNFVNLYRIRAAKALAEIGGPRAAGILDSAAHRPVRDSAR
ncbi:MAG: hypothetical protein ABI766_03840 [Gemmatimonadales bacterium]